jgi:hypothetical protein
MEMRIINAVNLRVRFMNAYRLGLVGPLLSRSIPAGVTAAALQDMISARREQKGQNNHF